MSGPSIPLLIDEPASLDGVDDDDNVVLEAVENAMVVCVDTEDEDDNNEGVCDALC